MYAEYLAIYKNEFISFWYVRFMSLTFRYVIVRSRKLTDLDRFSVVQLSLHRLFKSCLNNSNTSGSSDFFFHTTNISSMKRMYVSKLFLYRLVRFFSHSR